LLVDVAERHRLRKPSLCASSSQFAKSTLRLTPELLFLHASLTPGTAGLNLKLPSLRRADLTLLTRCHQRRAG
jgi:aspartyl/asparaginyl beta-hydroxylase (cupin superfamily)